MEILKDLFDEKIIRIINSLLDNPEKQYSLTEVSRLSRVNVATTSRILNKLIEKKFIKSTVVGKIRIYQLERNQKTFALTKLLKKDATPLQIFINKISEHPRIKKVILETKLQNEAKLLLVGDFLPREKINKLCDKIKKENNFKIQFVEISENQYKNLKDFKTYDMENKVIWERSKDSPSEKQLPLI